MDAEPKKYRESHLRSLLKAFSWRVGGDKHHGGHCLFRHR